jgi:hypothetical protein
MGWITQHKLMSLVIVLMLLGSAWYFLTQTSAPISDSLITTVDGGDGASPTGEVDQEVVTTLLALHAVTLSAPIFDQPAFAILKDFGTEIVPEPIGRPNPFAPLGVGGGSTVMATTTNTSTSGSTTR